MSSLFGSMAGAAANAMQGAAIGRAIGGANDRADHATNQANLWYDHAKQLEAEVDSLKLKLKSAKESGVDLATKLQAAEKELVRLKDMAGGVIDEKSLSLAMNIKYGKEIKKRLIQMEKGLQHSSADRVSITFMLSTYKELFGDFSTLLNEGAISLETKEKAESVWTAFMNGDKLTDSKPIQDLIDLAPMPEKTALIRF